VRRASQRMLLANAPLQTFRNPKPELLALLQESGAADANGVRNKDAAKKKNRRDKNVDMEKLADGLQKLSEDDLLHVVTLVHDNKTSETYTKNDVESMSFRTAHFEEMLTSRRRRVPRRPLHAARFAGQDAVGLHGTED
jgi:transcription initiation factor IIF auxiliary subunit